MLAHEKFHSLKNKLVLYGWLTIKLYMENIIYDRVEWNFILVMLKKLGFHPWWIGWIGQCISMVPFCVC